MWIAKPIDSLTEAEKKKWIQTQQKFELAGIDFPFSQTLTWAQGIRSLLKPVFLVFSLEEGVGGIVYIHDLNSKKIQFECINGPMIHWHDPQQVMRQLATFAMAVSKLDRNFGSLMIKPRWLKSQSATFMKNLAIAPFEVTEAATLQLPVFSDERCQWDLLSPRLRRTLKNSKKFQITKTIEKMTSKNLEEFFIKMEKFSKSKNFEIPPFQWFQALTQENSASRDEGILFRMISSQVEQDEAHRAEASLLMATLRNKAYYLFGNQITNARAALSPSSLVQWEALSFCRENQIHSYDLNGYVDEVSKEHSYAGVCQFKGQMGGTLIQYQVPEFRIA